MCKSQIPSFDDFFPSDLSSTEDPYGYYRVAVLPGAVHLDGVHESERQQQVLLAIRAQASHLNVADLPTLATAFNGEIKTSISLEKLRALLSIANDYNGSNVQRILLVPPYTSEDGRRDRASCFRTGTICFL